MSVPTDLRYTKDHEWVRVDGDDGDDRESPPTPRTSSATSSSSSCPMSAERFEQFATFGVVESVKAVSDLFAPVSGEVIEANGALAASPELVNSSPYGDGWMIRVRVADAAQLDGLLEPEAYDALDRGGLTLRDAVRSAHRRRSGPDAGCPRPHVRRSALRGHPRGPPGVPPRPSRPGARARARRPPERPRGAQPNRPRLVPRGRRLPPLEPTRGRPAPAPWRVVHGLHAVPARDQPGHPAEHLRVRVA